jgi:hypothetical protein
MGSNGAVFLVQSFEVGAEVSQFQFCEFVCWTKLVVGFEVHLWVVEARGLGRLVLPKVGSSDVVAKSIDDFVNVI